jgi:hypothetical protein
VREGGYCFSFTQNVILLSDVYSNFPLSCFWEATFFVPHTCKEGGREREEGESFSKIMFLFSGLLLVSNMRSDAKSAFKHFSSHISMLFLRISSF